MNDIQIDMYPVGLGSAMLMQFTDERGDRIRVLADGGVGKGKKPEIVRDALLEELLHHDSDCVNLDLVVGTHYDEDHLAGLVPILKEMRFQIGEIWLPPIVNDTGDMHKDPIEVNRPALLAHQFMDENLGTEALSHYLRSKVEIVVATSQLLSTIEVIPPGKPKAYNQVAEAVTRLGRVRLEESVVEYHSALVSEFRNVERASGACLHDILGSRGTRITKPHSNDDEVASGNENGFLEYPPWNWQDAEFPDEDGKYIYSKIEYGFGNGIEAMKAFLKEVGRNTWAEHSEDGLDVTAALLEIVRGQARDAITAETLSKVVNALRERNRKSGTKTGMQCLVIPTNQPLRLGWDAVGKRFVESNQVCGNSPALTVLAPSESLIQKHYRRLPVGDYGFMVAGFKYDLRDVSASNQLSYVVRAEHKGQGILISGDTGMVDFVRRSRRPRKYEEAMLKELMPLHVVQVAHHGGRNWYFYEVLMEAGYYKNQEQSYLLLSHAVNDHHRPSDVFADFMDDLRKWRSNVRVLFTSRPNAGRVAAFRPMLEEPKGPISDEGSIRISFSQGNWSVDRHSVQA